MTGAGISSGARPRRGELSAGQLAVLWLSIFASATGLFILRFLVPAPVGMADNGDGPRLMCRLGVGPVTGGHARYDAYAYFQFANTPSCKGVPTLASSQDLLLHAARWLTPVLGLHGTVNLVALGLIACVIAGFAIAVLTVGLRMPVPARLAVASVLWLIVADSVFFDNFASPFGECSALLGLLLAAAGCVYLCQGLAGSCFGLALTGAGGYLAAQSKEQYQVLVIPVAVTVLLAAVLAPSSGTASPSGTARLRGWHLRSIRVATAAGVAGLLLWSGAQAAYSDYTSPFTKLLQQEQVVDTVFHSIVVPGQDNTGNLQALGLPASWSKYAGDGYWSHPSAANDPLYPRYASRLTDADLARFYAGHPTDVLGIGQQAAVEGLHLRVTYRGNYAPSGHGLPGALDGRITLVSRLASGLADLGLFLLVPLWLGMLALARTAWRRRHAAPWRLDAAILTVCLSGCAMAAFIPPAYFAGAETTHHMVGMSLATLLLVPVGLAVLGSLFFERTRPGRRWGRCSGAVCPRRRRRDSLTEVPRPGQAPAREPRSTSVSRYPASCGAGSCSGSAGFMPAGAASWWRRRPPMTSPIPARSRQVGT